MKTKFLIIALLFSFLGFSQTPVAVKPPKYKDVTSAPSNTRILTMDGAGNVQETPSSSIGGAVGLPDVLNEQNNANSLNGNSQVLMNLDNSEPQVQFRTSADGNRATSIGLNKSGIGLFQDYAEGLVNRVTLNQFGVQMSSNDGYNSFAGFYTDNGSMESFRISSANSTFKGILGMQDYSLNYEPYSFVQKEWVENLMGDGDLQSVLEKGHFSTEPLHLGTLSVNSIELMPASGEVVITNPAATAMYQSQSGLETVYMRTDQNEYLTIGAYGLTKQKGAYVYGVGFQTPTADRTQMIPNKDGTFAMTSDISGYTGFVPYTGATSTLNMGSNQIFSTDIRATDGSTALKFSPIPSGATEYGLINPDNDRTLVTYDYDNSMFYFGDKNLQFDLNNSIFNFGSNGINGSYFQGSNFTQNNGIYDGASLSMTDDDSWQLVDVNTGSEIVKYNKLTGNLELGPTNIYAHGNLMLTSLNIEDAINDGTTNKAPSQNAVSDALKLKVDGPASAVDNKLARFDGSSGKVIQNSGWTLNDDDTMTVVGMGANQLLGVAASGIKTEFKYLVGTAGHISVTHATNGITLDLSNCVKNTTDSALTGTTTETIITSLLVPSGMFVSGDIMKVSSFDEKLLANGTNLIKYYVNSTNSLSGATMIFQYSSAAGNKTLGTSREYFLKPSNVVYGHASSANNLLTTDTATANSPLSATFTYTGSFYVIKTFTLASGTDNAIGKSFRVEKL